jgi:type IV secretory pathway VirJ component
MYVMHHAFRRDLDAFSSAVRWTPADATATWRLLADRWELFAQVLHEHHAGEDTALWPALLERGTAEDVATLEAMEAEHAEVDPLLESCAAGFRRLATRPDEDARAALAVRVCAARESLRRHLAHEESEAMAILQRVLTPGEWQAIDEEAFQQKVGLAHAARLVPWAAYGLPREALERVLGDVEPAFRLLHRLTRRGFARRERRTFRYA